MTVPTRMVLETLSASETPLCGVDLMRALTIGPSTVYPLLKRLHGNGWVDRQPEGVDPSEKGEPEKIFYSLTKEANDELEQRKK